MKQVTKQKVTAVVCTRNRYFDTLPLCLSAIATQTYKPEEIIIYDDGDHIDIRNSSPYNNLFPMIQTLGMSFKVIFTNGGQVVGHRKSLFDSTGDFIWRVDDDEVPESNVLEILMSNMKEGVGAVAGCVLDPKNTLTSTLASNKMEDIYLGANIQWFKHTEISEVDHLYSSFVYRKEAVKPEFYANLSRVGHREETIFSYEIKRAGYKLIVDPTATTWHLRNPNGGIRSEQDHSLWQKDEFVFSSKLREWGIQPTEYKFVALDAGLGDHLMFKEILQDMKKKYPKIIMAICYPEVFKDEKDIKFISIAEIKAMMNIEELNIYKYAWDRNWGESLINAYRSMYNV